MQLTNEEKSILLKRARDTIHSAITGAKPVKTAPDKNTALKEKAGAFVTLTKEGELRGCIGYITSSQPVIDTVTEAAEQAALKDPRFIPVKLSELDNIEIEISVLSPPSPISSYDEIEIGKHGLILDHMSRRAVLLPQVAVDYNMDLPMFLEAICEKGGFPGNLWKERQLNLKVFTATIFSETEFKNA